jgi:uncharacterized protein with NRDE domain
VGGPLGAAGHDCASASGLSDEEGMCLLVVLHRVHPKHPIIVAANRDELIARPATALTVLRDKDPRILGGRDELAGGTWLAVNEHGLIAGLTNLPNPGAPPPAVARRSRGELPMRLARHHRAAPAVAAFRAEVRSADYNPAWLLCGDGDALFYLDVTTDHALEVEELGPGIYVLENRRLHEPSPKAAHVRAQLEGVLGEDGETLVAHLTEVLRDHRIPAGAEAGGDARPPVAHAACVHAGPYGTRSSTIVLGGSEGERPTVFSANGPPCTTPFERATLWG